MLNFNAHPRISALIRCSHERGASTERNIQHLIWWYTLYFAVHSSENGIFLLLSLSLCRSHPSHNEDSFRTNRKRKMFLLMYASTFFSLSLSLVLWNQYQESERERVSSERRMECKSEKLKNHQQRATPSTNVLLTVKRSAPLCVHDWIATYCRHFLRLVMLF
jgi:hypothetical protein